MIKTKKEKSIKELSEEIVKKEVYKIKDGVNIIFINTSKEVRCIETKFGDRYVFEIYDNEKHKDLIVSEYLMNLIVSELIKSGDIRNTYIRIFKQKINEKVKYEVSIPDVYQVENIC